MTTRSTLALGCLLIAACRDQATVGGQSPDATGSSGLGVSVAVHLRASTGQYVVAELGGGGAVNANRPAAGPWETFTLLSDGALQEGAPVRVRTDDGHFLQAELGGGHGLTASTTNQGPWETFTVVKAGGGAVSSGDDIALRADSGHYVVAEGGGGGLVNANRTAVGPWETFRLELGGSASSGGGAGGGSGGGAGGGSGGGSSGAGVLPEDTVLLPPVPSGAVLGTITGYEMNAPCPFGDASHCELPLYSSYDRDTPEFWDILVQELLHSRVNVVMAHGRGCYSPTSGLDGNGNMCPRLLTRLVDAIDRAGARGVLRLGMFDDTGAYQGARDTVEGLPQSTRFDLADHTSWRFFWDHNMKIWFDTVPRDLWYRLDGHPVVAFWSLSSYFFANQRGNASALLRELKRLFQERYGEEPLFLLDSTWISEDPTITTAEAYGVNDWFDPRVNVSTLHTWNGRQWGATVPSYRDPDTAPGCGAACREYPRRDGQTLRTALQQGAGAKFTLLEGWTNVAESAGYYRSAAWRYPNQYIELVREFADPGAATLRLEAEAADEFSDATPDNLGGQYRPGPLDVGRIPGGGWHVGWIDAGEWIRFKEVALACGTYRFTARVASPLDGQRVRLKVGGAVAGEVAVPNTGGWDSYALLHLGELTVPRGAQDLTVEFPTGGLNLDWVFVRKASACP